MMMYTVEVSDNTNQIKFRFNNFGDMTEFLQTVTETADGFEEGETQITVKREETENE